MSKPSPPFTSESNRIVLTKIIVIYAVFYMAMKLIAILFKDALAVTNLVVCLPFLLLALWGWYSLKRKATNWLYIIVAIIAVSAIRYYEADLLPWLEDKL